VEAANRVKETKGPKKPDGTGRPLRKAKHDEKKRPRFDLPFFFMENPGGMKRNESTGYCSSAQREMTMENRPPAKAEVP
jgi:hypothetical protein